MILFLAYAYLKTSICSLPTRASVKVYLLTKVCWFLDTLLEHFLALWKVLLSLTLISLWLTAGMLMMEDPFGSILLVPQQVARIHNILKSCIITMLPTR